MAFTYMSLALYVANAAQFLYRGNLGSAYHECRKSPRLQASTNSDLVKTPS